MTALNCAVLTVSDTRTAADDTSGDLLVGFIEEDIRQIVTRTGMNTAELQVFLNHDISTKIFMQEIQQSLASLGAESITLRQSQTAIGEILGTNLSDLAV